MIKKCCPIIIGCFLFVFIVSCDKAENVSNPATSNENILRIDMFGAFPSLNPQDDNLGCSGDIFLLLYSYLCVPDETGELKPDLALSWTYDSQSFVWTIALRDDAFFHDNRPVTSKDAVFSLIFSFNNSEEALFDLVREITPVSGSKLCIFLKKDDPDFIKKIWGEEISPYSVDGSVNNSDQANHPVGSGPFQFVSKTGLHTAS